MYLQIVFPGVDADAAPAPSHCPYPPCTGERFRLRQRVVKPIQDAFPVMVTVRRYQCLTCGRSFRIYPSGISRDQVSGRIKRLGALLYLLGLSYGQASAVLAAEGVYLSRSQIHAAASQVRRSAPGVARQTCLAGSGVGPEGRPRVRWAETWLSLTLICEPDGDLVLQFGALAEHETRTLGSRLTPLVTALSAEVRIVRGPPGFAGDAPNAARGGLP